MADPSFLWVFVYQIRDKGRSVKVADVLRFRGNRVRPGAFEVMATQAQLRRLLLELALLLSPDDRMRVYRVCESCRQSTVLFGPGRLASLPSAIIV